MIASRGGESRRKRPVDVSLVANALVGHERKPRRFAALVDRREDVEQLPSHRCIGLIGEFLNFFRDMPRLPMYGQFQEVGF